jgi:mutual gliding-motility protein MglA
VQFNVQQREIVLKVVYYGPPLCGKTSNLQALHKLLDPKCTGHMTVLNTADDRTLFFDLLPVFVTTDNGYRLKLKLFTVPGQVIHAATRRIVLGGADGVVFVADSQASEVKVNNEFWHGMRRYLEESGVDPETVPLVIQFNKRDLPNVRTKEDIDKLRKAGPEPVFEAVAVRGEGVVETLHGLLMLMFQNLNTRYDFQNKFHISPEDFIRGIFGEKGPPANVAVAGSR